MWDDWLKMQEELEAMFGREVDLVSKKILEESLPSGRDFKNSSGDLCSKAIVMLHLFGIWLRQFAIFNLFAANLSFEVYLEDVLVRSAVERQFEILGEAARRISEGFRQIHPQIDWQRIIGLRNIVSHRYDEVNQEVFVEHHHFRTCSFADSIRANIASITRQ